MSQHCNTCCHWGGVWWGFDEPNRKPCAHPKVNVNGDCAADDEVEIAKSVDSYIRTGALFGCVHHSPKTPDSKS